MNIRVEILQAATEGGRETPAYIIEVGCMFSENEGLSTLVLARYAAATSGKLISIDADDTHIEAAKAIIRDKEPDLMSSIEFVTGYSLQALRDALDSVPRLDLAFLDGGAQPEVCLQEYEMAASALAPDGLIIIDDVQQMEETAAFPSPRPFGKGSLIYPALILGEYMRYRKEVIAADPDALVRPTFPNSTLVERLADSGVSDILTRYTHRLITRGTHGMLLVGQPDVIDDVLAALRA